MGSAAVLAVRTKRLCHLRLCLAAEQWRGAGGLSLCGETGLSPVVVGVLEG
jgi:hypothetical protein